MLRLISYPSRLRNAALAAATVSMLWLGGCQTGPTSSTDAAVHSAKDTFAVESERFADLQVLRYRVPGFDELTLEQKKLAYYLYEAALSGRDIIYDQKYRHNLTIRRTIEGIWDTYSGDKNSEDWENFEVYAKQVWFANGIHHHYSNAKTIPAFGKEYFRTLLTKSDPQALLLGDMTPDAFADFYEPIIFDPAVDGKIVNLDPDGDLVKNSANNFYAGLTEKEVESFYASKAKKGEKNPVMHGLNSQLVRKSDGSIEERVWKVGGMYSPAIEKIVYWLEQAVTVAENDQQRDALQKLVKYYRTGDLKDFDEYCIAWVKDTDSRLDVVNGFIEVYGDAMGKRGSYESVVSMRDEEATKRIAAIANEAQWFEDNSPIAAEHKKPNVTGISAKVITVIVESGDAAPSTPIGINLPNSNWIRSDHGSKSVSLGNIVYSYNTVKAKSPTMAEFAESKEVLERIKKYSALAGDLHTDMHEVIGHASGRINDGVGTPDQTLKNYANTLEEARADLVALYYILDPKLVEIGVTPSTDVGLAEYDSYILNGLMLQLNRLKLGDNLEEAHMRNRQLIAKWAFEKGQPENVIEKVTRNGKTYFRINDYEKLRAIFGQLLAEIQRIKSEGDFEAGKALVENYGVKVDYALHKEVKDRYAKLDVAPYSGFIQPRLVPVVKDGQIVDVKVEYPTSFAGQMLEYGKKYSFLPNQN